MSLSTPYKRLKYLVDTHALIWAALDDPKLSRKAARAIHEASPDELGVSDVSIQELALLIHSDKVILSGRPSEEVHAWLEHYSVIPICIEAALLAPSLKLPHSDPFDRMIVATAITLKIPLITRDANIQDSGLVKIHW